MPSFFAKVSDLQSGKAILGEGFADRAIFEGNISKLGPDDDSAPVIAMAEKIDHSLWWLVTEQGEIIDVAVPVSGRVAAIEDVGEVYKVVLVPNQAPRFLRATDPQAPELFSRLTRALKSGAAVLVAETDDHFILDVQEGGASPEEGLGEDVDPFDPGSQMLLEKAESVSGPLPLQRVIDLFNKLKQSDCGPRPSGTTCIPFMYPDDGCWGRAHEMYRLLLAEGVTAEKAWIYGDLVCPTKNNPACRVAWGYHVAPKLEVEGTEEYVLDPSIFDAPVPASQWVAHQGGALTNLKASPGTVFYRPRDGNNLSYDPAFTQTKGVLNTYRLALVRRVSRKGPPPYSCP